MLSIPTETNNKWQDNEKEKIDYKKQTLPIFVTAVYAINKKKIEKK